MMKFNKKIPVVFTLLLLLSPQVVFGRNKKAENIEKYLKPFAARQQFSGVILAADGGKVIYEKAFGLANAEHNIPTGLDTKFNIASVTKAMTRAIAVRLIVDGKLGLQDKLSKFVPDFPNGEQITVEMLLRHRSGIPHRAIKSEEESLRYTPAQMVEKIKLAKLAFQPGEKRLYSSAGFTVLTRVLEIASGKTYRQLLQEYVFTPALIKNSIDFNGETLIQKRAQEYLLEKDAFVHAPLKDYSYIVGAGSVFSTARDVYQFGEAVLDGKLSESVKLSLTDKGVFSDNGQTNGFRCYVQIDRARGFGFVLISNLQSGANDMILRDLPEILQGKTVNPPTLPNPAIVPNPNKNLEEYFGTYKLGDSEFDVFAKGEQLYAGIYKLYPLGKDRFYAFGYYAEIEFKRGENGKVKESEWTSPTFKINWTKQ